MNSNLKEIEELTDGWVLCRSKSSPGRQYYFNRKTGKSSWTQPQPSDKFIKKAIVKEKFNHIEKRKKEEPRSKSAKRKSDGSEPGSSKKKVKNEIVEKSSPKKPQQKVSPKPRITNASPQLNSKKNDSPTKSMLSPESQRNRDSPSKVTPTKNLANKRLSQLREQLNADVSDELDREPSPRKNKRSLTPAPSETPARQRTEVSSPNVTEEIASTATKSPSSDSLHSTPSPSQFLAANKIIHSMRAQLSEEYCNIQKPKDTFSDIEQGICNQINEYPVIKHPSTPPQFSEANKLVSAIKSKLSYKRQDIKFYSSAKERMEAMRASISGEIDESDLPDESESSPTICPSKCEAMETGDIYDPNEVPNSSVPQPTVKDLDGEHVVLVVDSNIFIHELDFIKNVLNSHIKGYREQPTLLVPWRVINELDRLKDNNNGKGAVCKRARAAMDYLYKSLPENSRIKGQSLRDANSHIYPCELPDDEILNCALQQAERGRNVLLLSNDRNLCNKASVNNIKRCSIAELKELVEHKPQPATDPHLLTQLKHCEHAIYQLLSNILENEMRAKYNNLWQHILFKPPPWQLCDVLQCLLKHWIAVFNEVFPRIEHLITDLKNTHERIVTKDPKTLTHSELDNFKELCVDVASKCQIIPEYMALAKLTVERLARRASETDDAGARETVVGAFEELWTHMSSYCAKLATALGVPHAVEDPLPGAEPLPTLATKFTDYNTSVEELIVALRGVLNTEQSSLEQVSCRLHAALAAALRPAPRAPVPRGGALRDFCLANRNMLEEALNKFTQLAQLLTACGASVGQCRPG